MDIFISPPGGQAPQFVDVPFNDLNGTPVAGQTLSLRIRFDRAVITSNPNHGALLMLYTSNVGPTIPTHVAGTASLLDGAGNPLHVPMPLYVGGTNDGGLVSAAVYTGVPMEQPNPITGQFGYVGVQYDFTLPSMEATIERAQLRFVWAEIIA